MSSIETDEGSVVVSSDQINYKQKLFSHPSYRFEPQYPNTFGQNIVLGASQVPIVINMPPEVFNLSESYLVQRLFTTRTSKYIHMVLTPSIKRNITHSILCRK